MNNKPDWKDAPEWANYLAMDEDGAWWWYECKPFSEETAFGTNAWFSKMGSEKRVQRIPGWKNSLEEKPND